METPDITGIHHIDFASADRFLTGFEREFYSEKPDIPVADFARTLRRLRRESQDIGCFREEIDFAVHFDEQLTSLRKRHELGDGHFSIDLTGDPLLICEDGGEHLIAPTHFEAGAYFSHPHADHQTNFSAGSLPRLKIGQYVRFGRNASVNAGGDVTIGNGVWLSPGSQLLRQDHNPYGRPSVGSRTVAMTTLPSIVLADYAWIGREALIGWGGDYIGKCSIVATRSFSNTWVGDYSITGDHGRVIQYLPFKAYVVENLGYTFEMLLAVRDWSAINDEWLTVYRRDIQPSIQTSAPAPVLSEDRGDALVIDARSPNDVLNLENRKIDVICDKRDACASILQWAIDQKNYRIRFRGDLNRQKLPFPDAGESHYRRKSGYSLVLAHTDDEQMTTHLFAEIFRVTIPGGKIILKASACDLLLRAEETSLSKGYAKIIEPLALADVCYTVIERLV